MFLLANLLLKLKLWTLTLPSTLKATSTPPTKPSSKCNLVLILPLLFSVKDTLVVALTEVIDINKLKNDDPNWIDTASNKVMEEIIMLTKKQQ